MEKSGAWAQVGEVAGEGLWLKSLVTILGNETVALENERSSMNGNSGRCVRVTNGSGQLPARILPCHGTRLWVS